MASGLSKTLPYSTGREAPVRKLPEGASRDRSLSGKDRKRARRAENAAQRESNRA